MKKVIIILFLININTIRSQSLENLKKSDTIYILFDHGKSQEKFFEGSINPFYTFFFHNSIYKQFRFKHPITENYERITKQNVFLKNEKNKIIDGNFFSKYNTTELLDFFDNNRILYIIDTDDFVDNNIILKKVIFESTFERGQ
ncbi:hypothetical protein [Flavobacterium panici]|uniref:Uncharacterized protein n=1 Tax=Flavobacterium panici TaxID=2654843 RepID=A0A9N8IZT6_9FLAO|nr:hypothetical protein [Flavobacterium panici]CAC9973630.1 hypothetical protein FLAPXU55_01315 [Flavobacterium panici]